jgi:hypothetical protein
VNGVNKDSTISNDTRAIQSMQVLLDSPALKHEQVVLAKSKPVSFITLRVLWPINQAEMSGH